MHTSVYVRNCLYFFILMHPSFIVLTVSFLIVNAHAGAQSEDNTSDSVTDICVFLFNFFSGEGSRAVTYFVHTRSM